MSRRAGELPLSCGATVVWRQVLKMCALPPMMGFAVGVHWFATVRAALVQRDVGRSHGSGDVHPLPAAVCAMHDALCDLQHGGPSWRR
jgi:hypothetical protein